MLQLNEITRIFAQISETLGNSYKNDTINLRKQAIHSINSTGIVKLAFDTRRIDQETEFNPRRGLQNYHRSEQFITEAQIQKVAQLKRIKSICVSLKDQYGKEPEWQDSYSRILLNSLNQALKSTADITANQQSIGSLDYIDELLYTRYRLDTANLDQYTDDKLRSIILSKDQELTNKISTNHYEITKQDISKHSYDYILDKLIANAHQNSVDAFLNKLLNGIPKISNDGTVERSITITVSDRVKDVDGKIVKG